MTKRETSTICVEPDFLLALLTELGKHRALADHETDIVEAIVCRGHHSARIRVHWTKPMDRRLLAAAKRIGGIRHFARQNDISEMATYKRLAKLRKGKATTTGTKG